jgi:hypothetical protein
MGGGASRHLCEALLLELINGFTAEDELLGNGELLHQFSFIGLRYVRHVDIALQDRAHEPAGGPPTGKGARHLFGKGARHFFERLCLEIFLHSLIHIEIYTFRTEVL